MKPSEVFEQNRDLIRRMVAASGMENPRLFGSIVHGEDQESSDLDLLVDPSPSTSLLDLARLQLALESAIGIKVDLRTPKFLHESFRDEVLAEAARV
jgi:predicted nucleotidyltransferase